MAKSITLIIDGKSVTVPEGTQVVDAAKKIGVDIPVFCYHPKMVPVGMCRMCLVEIGRPAVNRQTGQAELDADGKQKISMNPKLEIACATPVSEGMLVVTTSEKVSAARREVVEFILTSHPLDCPVCDKGGECPLQNLTIRYGPGQSRFLYDDKMHLAKHVPLGELIWLDRERCIQCGRCVRFQHELVDEPVIDFYQRGRALEIITESEPGFDSIFSGNTTDICPVGALTTSDFHFGARPWEMKSAASICTHCPVGCNLDFNVRREARSDGRVVIKRAMPRQNEAVNEIWICDKGRFGYHFSESPARLTQPLVRKNGELVPATWDEALDLAGEKVKAARASGKLTVLAGGRLTNEDLFNLNELAAQTGNGAALLYSYMAGGDLVMQLGMAPGSNLSQLGKGDVIVVAASDLHEEAPLWWLRVKQAAGRGATLIVASSRPTRLDAYAAHAADVRYLPGHEAELVAALTAGNAHPEIAQALTSAQHLVIFYGSDGLDLKASRRLAEACANLLHSSGHAGQVDSGLIPVWPNANTQGAWEVGLRPSDNLAGALAGGVVYIAAADPAGDDPVLAGALNKADFVIVQELFLTETAQLADVVLPVEAFTEREGTFTSGERRVQRFYPAAVPGLPGPKADFTIAALVGQRAGLDLEARSAALVLQRMAQRLPAWAGLSYQKLAETSEQWPIVGRSDLYYGGTSYENRQGLGVQLALAGGGLKLEVPPAATVVDKPALFPVTRLYDQGATLLPSTLLKQRLAGKTAHMNARTAGQLGASAGAAEFVLDGKTLPAQVIIDETLPDGMVMVPRSVGIY